MQRRSFLKGLLGTGAAAAGVSPLPPLAPAAPQGASAPARGAGSRVLMAGQERAPQGWSYTTTNSIVVLHPGVHTHSIDRERWWYGAALVVEKA